MPEQNLKSHNLILDSRKNLTITGVSDVLGFNEETVSVSTNLGDLIIRGANLHISKLDLETGDVEVDGVVNSLQYTESKNNKSLMQRLFR